MRERYARAEARNVQVRAGLEPLAPGERPTAVTVAAIVAALLVPANIAAAFLVDLGDSSAATVRFSILQAAVLSVAAWGMWRAKYWAVLGFQALLGITILLATLALLRASGLRGAALCVVVIVLSGWLFWKLVRAMARLQMPSRHPPA